MIVHCTDGDTGDGPIGGEVAAIHQVVPGAIVVQCLFHAGVGGSSLAPCPDTSFGDFWAMSSPYPGDDTTDSQSPLRRLFFVNTLAASREVVKLIRRLWPQPPAPTMEPSAAAPVAVASEAAVEPECPDAPEPAGPPLLETLRAVDTETRQQRRGVGRWLCRKLPRRSGRGR